MKMTCGKEPSHVLEEIEQPGRSAFKIKSKLTNNGGEG